MKPIDTNAVKRGEIYYYDFGAAEGSIQSGRRPVLVLQDDRFNMKSPTVIVASITAVLKKRYLPSHIFLGEEFGLSKPSMVLLEQIQTVNKSDLTEYIGVIDDEQVWKQINIAIKKTFGLWFYNLDRTGDVRCLCSKHLSEYLNTPSFMVRRLDSLASAKEKCDKCDNLGWDYIVFDRRKVFEHKEV